MHKGKAKTNENLSKSQDNIVQNKDYKIGLVIKEVGYFLKAIKCMKYTMRTELQFSENGLKIYAEESNYFQGRVIFPKDFFHIYQYKAIEDQISFGLSLDMLMSFSALVTEHNVLTLKLLYFGAHQPLQFELYDEKATEASITASFIDDDDLAKQNIKPGIIFTEFFIKTKSSIQPVDFDQMKGTEISTLIASSSEIYVLLNEFDKGIEEIELIVKTDKIKIKSVGRQPLTTNVTVLAKNENIFYRYEVDKRSAFCYKLAAIRAMFKGMQLGDKISITTLDSGLLKIQLLKYNKSMEVLPMYLEYYTLPSIGDSDNEDDYND